MAEEKIAVGKKVVIEMLDDAPLRGKIEVNQDIAAEDDVHAFHESHGRILGQVQAAEFDVLANLGLDLHTFPGGREIFLAIVSRQIASAVAAIDGSVGVSQGALVNVGGEDFKGPAFEAALHLLEQQHAEGVRFFAGGASRAPDAHAMNRKFCLGLNNLGDNDISQGVQLR